MWPMIPSLEAIVQACAPAFTLPSFHTHCQLVLGWVLCLGRHRLCRVADAAQPQSLRDHSRRHGLDTTYNFFERSAWTVTGLAYHVAVLILTRLHLCGTLTLLVDDTLAHKRGRHVFGIGWFRDAVASTRKRTATASGHNWVVVALAVCLPGTNAPVLALPLLARLHRPGQAQPDHLPDPARPLVAGQRADHGRDPDRAEPEPGRRPVRGQRGQEEADRPVHRHALLHPGEQPEAAHRHGHPSRCRMRALEGYPWPWTCASTTTPGPGCAP